MTIAFNDLPRVLSERLASSQATPRCWFDFVPELCYGRHAGPPAHDARHAAVLVLLYQHLREWRVPLIVRPDTMASHAGQVSFPGGEIEGAETLEETALRECCEELGTAGSPVTALGRLAPVYVYASNFLVTPCVAWTPRRPDFVCNEAEVARLLEPTVRQLLLEECRGAHWIERRGVRFRAPHITFGRWKIWGATSLMLAELLQALRD